MLDPLYSLRPKRGRHSFWARARETEKEHITVRRNDLPGIAAHTAAGGPKRARESVTSTGLELRKRIPLARSARSCAAPPLEKPHCKTVVRSPGQAGGRQLLDFDLG